MTSPTQAARRIDIVFDGPPGPTAGRFVEVEDETGRSIRVGEWLQREDGYWALRIALTTALSREAEMRAALEEIKAQAENATFARMALDNIVVTALLALSSHGSPREDGWRDISTAPKDGTDVLLFFPGPWNDPQQTGVVCGAFVSGWWWIDGIWASSTAHKSPTLWQPLPTPPLQPSRAQAAEKEKS